MADFEVEGTDRLRRKLGRLGEEIRGAVKTEVRRSALNVQAGAKERAPRGVDGRLANSISVQGLLDWLDAKVGTNLIYAMAIEFGLPVGHRPPAKALERWVRLKLGITDPREVESVAFAIATHIERHGTEAQPFLHPAAEQERPKFRKRVRASTQDAIARVAGV